MKGVAKVYGKLRAQRRLQGETMTGMLATYIAEKIMERYHRQIRNLGDKPSLDEWLIGKAKMEHTFANSFSLDVRIGWVSGRIMELALEAASGLDPSLKSFRKELKAQLGFSGEIRLYRLRTGKHKGKRTFLFVKS